MLAVAVDSISMAPGFTRTFSYKYTMHFECTPSLSSCFPLPPPISTFYSLLSLPGHLHIHDFMYLIKIQDPQKKREVIQYGSFWDLVSLKNLSASHICKMNFSHFLPPFPSHLSLCLLYDNLQLHPLSWKWHDFVLRGWIKSHGVYGPHFLFSHSPGSVQQLNCGGFSLKILVCQWGITQL